VGIVSFTFPLVQSATGFFLLVRSLREWVRGLAALVVLFDVYAIWQHLQLQSVRRQLQEQQALRHAEEKYRAIFEDAVVGIFRPLRKVVRSVSTARWRKCTATILQNNAG